MNKCFLLNPEKKLVQIRLAVFEKNAKSAPLIPKNDVTMSEGRRLRVEFTNLDNLQIDPGSWIMT